MVRRGGLLASAEAVRLRRLAELGDVRAQCHLALCYAKGENITRDLAAAAAWLERASLATQAAPEMARDNLYDEGWVWRNSGTDAPLSPSEALQTLVQHVLREALIDGHPAAQGALARWYASGRHGLQQDYEEAGRMAWKASEAGDPNGQLALGWLYGNGEGGFGRDEVRALHWFRLAAQQGCTDAAYNMGLYYHLGCGGLAQNEPLAVQWFHRAADEGHVEAAFSLAAAYRKGSGGLRRDKQAALHWYEFAAARGHGKAEDKLKRMRSGSGKRLGLMVRGAFSRSSGSSDGSSAGGSVGSSVHAA